MIVRSRFAGLAALALLTACGSKTDVDNQEAAATANADNAEYDADARAEALDAQADLLNNEAARIGGNEANALENRAATDEKAADAIVKRGEEQARQIEDSSAAALQNKQ
jgi:hypothetical protein